MKRRRVPPKALAGIVAAVVIVYLVAGWFLLVSPKRSQVSSLEAEIADIQVQLVQARAAVRPGARPPRIEVADIFRLSKAMPAKIDMPGILLELSRVADETGIGFDSIAPAATTSAGSYQVLPIQLVFQGNYYGLSDFLFRLRNLVGVRGGKLDATGRLFSVDRLEFTESPEKFPEIQAALTVSAFVYGADPAVAAAAAQAAAAASSSSSSESPPSDTTPPAAPGSNGATAQGATP